MLNIRYAFLEDSLGRGYNIEKFVDAMMEENEPDRELDQLEAAIEHFGFFIRRAVAILGLRSESIITSN